MMPQHILPLRKKRDAALARECFSRRALPAGEGSQSTAVNTVEFSTLQGLDHRSCLRRAGAADSFQNLSHGRIPQITARGGSMVVFIDHRLNESLRALRGDFRVPDEPPNSRVVRISEWPADL